MNSETYTKLNKVERSILDANVKKLTSDYADELNYPGDLAIANAINRRGLISRKILKAQVLASRHRLGIRFRWAKRQRHLSQSQNGSSASHSLVTFKEVEAKLSEAIESLQKLRTQQQRQFAS